MDNAREITASASSFERNTRPFAAVFLFSVLLGLFQVRILSSPLRHIVSDMHGYVDRAQQLAAGMPAQPFDIFYPPGTHYFFALFFLFFSKPLALAILAHVQAVLVAGANICFGLAVREFFRSSRAGIGAALGASLYWPLTGQASFFMAELPFMLFSMLGLFLFARAFNGAQTRLSLFLSGLTLGTATLIKAQGICAFAPLPLVLLFLPQARAFRSHLFHLCLGFAIPVLLQLAINSAHLGRAVFFLSANDAFNLYLGQSRREAVGCFDKSSGYFYIFHNNNAGLDYRFLAPEILPVSILDREYFRKKTAELWRSDPMLQLIRSLQNTVELFEINPRWPLRNIPQFARADLIFQYLFFLFAVLPAFITCAAHLNSRCLEPYVVCAVVPVLAVGAVSFFCSGQPRYLLPFSYSFILLAVPFYRALFMREQVAPINKALHPPANTQRLCLAQSTMIGAAILIGLFFAAKAAVKTAYLSRTPERASSLQDNYLEPPLPKESLAAWFEFGRNGHLVTVKHLTQPGISAELSGFLTGRPWPRAVSWHASAENQGTLRLRFSPQAVSKIALYLTDGDSYFRASRIRSENTDVIAAELHNGAWYVIYPSASESSAGLMTLSMQKLLGRSVSISALAVSR